MFEPGAKHTYDEAAGKNVANPTAALLASAKMLQVIQWAFGNLTNSKYVANPTAALLASAKMLQVIQWAFGNLPNSRYVANQHGSI